MSKRVFIDREWLIEMGFKEDPYNPGEWSLPIPGGEGIGDQNYISWCSDGSCGIDAHMKEGNSAMVCLGHRHSRASLLRLIEVLIDDDEGAKGTKK